MPRKVQGRKGVVTFDKDEINSIKKGIKNRKAAAQQLYDNNIDDALRFGRTIPRLVARQLRIVKKRLWFGKINALRRRLDNVSASLQVIEKRVVPLMKLQSIEPALKRKMSTFVGVVETFRNSYPMWISKNDIGDAQAKAIAALEDLVARAEIFKV